MACYAVYCLTFALGSSFDYRLIFLVGVIPYLIEIFERTQRREILLTTALVISFLWISRIGKYVLFTDSIFDFCVFTVGAAFLYGQLIAHRSPIPHGSDARPA